MKKYIESKSFIALIILVIASANSQFQHTKGINNLHADQDVSSIPMINNLKITPLQGGNQHENAIMHKGELLQNKIKDSKLSNHSSNIRINEKQIYSNNGQKQTLTQVQNLTTRSVIKGQFGKFIRLNQSFIILQNFQYSPNFSLILLNLVNKNYTKKIYNITPRSNNYDIKLINQSALVTYLNSTLYIISAVNLQILQKLILQTKRTTDVAQISSFYAKGTDNRIQNTITVSVGPDDQIMFVVRYNQQKGMYEKKNKFYSTHEKFQLVSLDEGVTFDQYYFPSVNRWRNLDISNVVYEEWNKSNPITKYSFIGVSNSEKYVAMSWGKYVTQNYLALFLFNCTNYTFKEKPDYLFTMPFQKHYFNSRDGRFTNDDKFLILTVEEETETFGLKFTHIAVINLQKQELNFIKQTDQTSKQRWNCTDFGILDNEKLITLCLSQSKPENGSKNSSYHYELRLYRLNDLKILDTYNITTKKFLDSSINSNPNFNYTFTFHNKLKEDPYDDSCQTFVFKVKNDKILNTNISSTAFEQYGLRDGYKYLISNRVQDNKLMRTALIDINTLQVVNFLPANFGQRLYIQKNILVLKSFLLEVYDLSKIEKDQKQWNLGKFQVFGYEEFDFNIIFANLKLMYMFSYYNDPIYRPSVVVVNLLINPIYQTTVMTVFEDNRDVARNITYVLADKNQKSNGQISIEGCNKVYFTVKMKIYTFNDRKPYNQASIINLNKDESIQQLFEFRISSSKQYAIFHLYRSQRYRPAPGLYLEVRKTNELNKIYYYHYKYYDRYYFYDTHDNQLVFNNFEGIYAQLMEEQIEISNNLIEKSILSDKDHKYKFRSE